MNMTTIPLIQNDRQRETLTSQFHVDALRAQHECGALGRRSARISYKWAEKS